MMAPTPLERLAQRVLNMTTPDKLRFAAELLDRDSHHDKRHDLQLAKAVAQRAVDELTLVQHLDRVGASRPAKEP